MFTHLINLLWLRVPIDAYIYTEKRTSNQNERIFVHCVNGRKGATQGASASNGSGWVLGQQPSACRGHSFSSVWTVHTPSPSLSLSLSLAIGIRRQREERKGVEEEKRGNSICSRSFVSSAVLPSPSVPFRFSAWSVGRSVGQLISPSLHS